MRQRHYGSPAQKAYAFHEAFGLDMNQDSPTQKLLNRRADLIEERVHWIPQNAWTTVPGTGLQVYSYADKPIRVGTDEEGSLAVCAGSAWLPRFCTLIIRKEIE